MEIVILLAIVFVVGGLIWYLITIYNGLIELKNDIDKAWANIDVLLKQRHDELTNLVAVCKGYMEYERDTFEKVAQARSQYNQAVTVGQKAQADQSMTQATHGLFAVAENYPNLKASNNFLQLQQRITELESQIADRREFYNDCVNTYNVRIQQAPDMVVAGWMNLKPRQMFKVEEADKANVPMVFSTGAR